MVMSIEERRVRNRAAQRKYKLTLTEEQKAKNRARSLRNYYNIKDKPEFAEQRRAWQRKNRAKVTAATRKWQAANPEKVRETQRAYKAANPEKTKISRRRCGIRTYGITPEQHATLLAEQNGLCAICRRLPKEGRELAIDHCHRSTQVRGLLCSNCNNGLGRFKDNPELLYEAAAYLERYRCQ